MSASHKSIVEHRCMHMSPVSYMVEFVLLLKLRRNYILPICLDFYTGNIYILVINYTQLHRVYEIVIGKRMDA